MNYNEMIMNALEELEIPNTHKEDLDAVQASVSINNKGPMNVFFIANEKLESIRILVPAMKVLKLNEYGLTRDLIMNYNLQQIIYGTLALLKIEKLNECAIVYSHTIFVGKKDGVIEVSTNEIAEIITYISFLENEIRLGEILTT